MEEDSSSGHEELRARLLAVERRIASSAERAGRSAEDVRLIAVSKTHPSEAVSRAIEAGVADLGENRVQEADAKIAEVGRERARWHLIGHLQSNKARRAVSLFDLIHSLDSLELAQRLDRLCVEEGRESLPVLIQVDLAGEATKSGISEENLEPLVEAVMKSDRLVLKGFMTLPPFFEEPEEVRPFFRHLRELRDLYWGWGVFDVTGGELSMGMSHDFEVAIEEGATMVRVGTAIFGERKR